MALLPACAMTLMWQSAAAIASVTSNTDFVFPHPSVLDTIEATCSLEARPTPVSDFFIRVADYEYTGIPAFP